MEKEEFDALVKSLPHRQVMAGLKIYMPRMLNKTLAITKTEIYLLEEAFAAGDNSPEIMQKSRQHGCTIIDTYYPPDEALKLKNELMGVTVNTAEDDDFEEKITSNAIDQNITTKEQSNNTPPPPPPVIEKTEETKQPAGPPGLTKEQKIAAILKTIKENGSITIQELSNYGINVFQDTNTINLAGEAMLTRDADNETHFIILKKKTYEKEIAAVVIGGILMAFGIGSAVSKK